MNKFTANVPEKAEIKKAVNDYCKEKGLSKASFGVKCEVSDATLCALEKEQWNSISKAMSLKIWNFVNQDKTNSLFKSIDFAGAINACDNARKHCFMLGITADTGMGKTTALRTYARQKNVYYVSYDKTMNAGQFFAALLRELAIPFYGTLNEMMNRAAEELNRLEAPLVIIDEAGKLTHAMILYLQVLRDRTCWNCGIVLSGMPYFKANLQKYTSMEKEGYAEFMRRINVWHEFVGLQPKEIEEICAIHEITDNKVVKDMKRQKRFGDLMNAIYLYQVVEGIL